MPISDYSTTRDSNASIAPGDLRSNDYRRDQQIINAIRQLMADLASMAAGGTNGIEKITIVRAGAEAAQYFELGLSDAGGHNIKGFSASNNGKGFIFDATTDDANTVPSSGDNRHEFRIRGVPKFVVTDNGRVDIRSGWLQFPATQIPHSDANILDDYEEGAWTPVITFSTAGDLNVVYGTQQGRYVKIGRWVIANYVIITTTFTHTTAAGECRITGLPFTAGANITAVGALNFGNAITLPGGRTQLQQEVAPGVAYGRPVCSGNGVGRTTLTPADMPTGNVVALFATVMYEAAN